MNDPSAADLHQQPPAARAGSGEMFDAIAVRYDLLNRILSLGLDRGWRRAAVDSLSLVNGAALLDLACGTGDVALEAARRVPGVRITGVDPSGKMLAIARDKARRAGLETIEFAPGSAEQLPFDDAAFDAATMAFGIRNVPDRPTALRELRRVLRPGGRLAILELVEPRGPILGRAARFHVQQIVPRLGALLSGAREYRYLRESIEAFPPPEVFAGLLENAGFAEVSAQPLTFGSCCLFTAAVPGSRS